MIFVDARCATMERLFCLLVLTVVCSCNSQIKFHIIEEMAVGTLVGNIAVESGLQANFTDEELTMIKFSFLDQTEMRHLFLIHENTGNIMIDSIIDREAQCIYQDLCVLKFDVAAHSSNPQLFEIYSIEITIEDKNDNSPQFSVDTVTIHVTESAVVKSSFGLIEATDLDSTTKNSIQLYELLHNRDTFALSVNKTSDERFNLRLVLLKVLDREEMDKYHVQLLAKDGGNPQNTGTLNINIIVDDENDNAPVFEQDSYAISINENTAKQTPLLGVKAYDKDAGFNGEIVYSFNPRQPEIDQIMKVFTIDSHTGVIYSAGDVVYGKQNVFRIDVVATDKGSQPHEAHAFVEITVLDTTNNKPDVHLNFLIPENESFVSLQESAKVGTVIAHVTAEDSDSGANGQVICMITNKYVTLQNISGKPGYLIVLNSEFDREVKEEYYISVTCSDNGSPKLSATKSFILRILDDNDNAPVFLESTYSATIDENNSEGQYCLRVSASDADVWPNDNIRYVLSGNSNDFSINPKSGIISASQRLDREKMDEYRFTVLAIDGGNQALTGTSIVVIFVGDLNDNKPRFDVPYFQFFVKENNPSGIGVGTVKAYDSDAGLNKDIMFSIVQTAGQNLPFTINENGELNAATSLDREDESSYTFEIVAKDRGVPSLSSRVFVRVYVTDENDNTPVIRYPNNINNTVHKTYSATSGTYLTTIEAYDIDEDGPNSLLRYEFVAGNEGDEFTLDRNSGKIYLKRQLSEQSTIIKTLVVKVMDSGDVPLETNVTFTLSLTYEERSDLAPFTPAETDNKNIIIVIAVVSMTIVISGALIAIICVLRHSEQIRKKHVEEHEKKTKITPQIYKEPEYMQKPEVNVQENLSFDEVLPEKGKEIMSSYDEDLNNMELYTSFGTSVFTDTLPGMEKPGQSMDDQRTMKRSSLKHILSDERISGIHSLGDISEISGEDNSDSGRGSSDPDLTRQTISYDQERFLHKPKSMCRNKNRHNSKQHYTEVQTHRNACSGQMQQKYYGFVDQPSGPMYNPNIFQRQDLKIVTFNEQGKFCVETSSFV